MTQKNSDVKRSAREALQERRAREEARAKRKRTVVVAGGVAAVLVVAAGIGIAVASRGSGGGATGSAASPQGATGKDNLVIPVGAPQAPATLTIYEDFRCPACDAFERAFTPVIHQLEDSGKARVDYHLVTIIDGNLGGSGSLNAANAAACAQDAGAFRAYHDVLYANQPNETEDKFADKNLLLRLAGKVKALRTPEFTACVNDGTHDGWVGRSAEAFGTSGFHSTPTVLLNGQSIYGRQVTPLSPNRLTQLVDAANTGKQPARATVAPTS